MKNWIAAFAFLATVTVQAQAPDVAPFLELRPTWQVRSTKKSLFQWYDTSGRYSLVGARIVLENGLRAYVAQRFQRVSSSGDPDTLDEYYIESRGHWRIGKQYLPFGRREILRTTVLAARLDTALLLDEAKLTVSVCDGGSGRTRGVVGRLGENIGISFAVGDHFAIEATDLAHFRNLEDAPGLEHGYRLAFGLDTMIIMGSAVLTLDWASLRRGETLSDGDMDLSDARLKMPIPGMPYRACFAWSRDWSNRRDFLTFELDMKGTEKISYVPSVRFEGLAFRDFGFSAVIKF